jgi:hypothetical protein
MKEPKQTNPYKASTRDSDVSKTAFPVISKENRKAILADTSSDEEWNLEIKHHCLGYVYTRNAEQHLRAAMQRAKSPNHEYEDRMKEVISLLKHVQSRWPVEWR